jgi:hypothetical protein
MKKHIYKLALVLIFSSGFALRLVSMAEFLEPPKIIQEPLVVGTGSDWAVVEWTTNAAGRGRSIVYAGTEKNDLQEVEQRAEPVKMSEVASYQEQQYTHLVRLKHLEPRTTYYFQVDSGSGNETEASSISHLTTTKSRGLTFSGGSIRR